MTISEMLALIQQRTKIADRDKKLAELRSAYRWVVRRVYNSADGPDLLATIGEELPALSGTTRDYDIGGNVTGGELIGIKKLWLKMPADTVFTSMIPADGNEQDFTNADSATTANPRIANGHPVLYEIVNFSQARFAPALPAGSVLRVDYFRMGPAPAVGESSETESEELVEPEILGEDLPSIFHDAMVSKATAQLFTMLDDSRDVTWELRAKDELNDAIYMGKRTQSPTVVAPFRARRRRYL